ncbi:glycosyltransferase family 4 protein [Streptomyces sp. H10-C2]|uniref:glycosyltransferase family 4 protein n=1 Tax=unclassified Streptomyces TaxID=2593676 RepID=UPI0024B8FEA5|nr:MULTISPECIES: glycosyltransferase family 4 protein [unclassified Streptomyces]MDJ0343183.1 glycosyltransferase family 4 protein [Streptomyces sp. PH10-H1]MDJ0371124.1 glycosyltransferase family 4 protein [Streptomyces sp. H10-C2]
MSSTPIPLRGQLHAVLVLGGAGGPTGAHVSSLAGGLVARGVRVTVCGPAVAEADYAFTGTGARFAPVEIAHRAARSDAAVVAALRAACADAEVVHAHGLRAGLLASLALSGRPTPLVVTWHSAVLAEGARARLLRWLERRVVRSAAVVLGASSDLVDWARTLGARDARLAPVAVPPPGPVMREPAAETERLRQKTRAEFGAEDRPLVLAVGRLEPHKGYDLLLDATRLLADRDPRLLVVVAGEGSQRAALERRIDTERLPVRLVGRRADVTELLAAADVVVLPSRWEARALIAQEALHAGVPLVATAVGGIPELVGEAAELVPYGDPAALARVVGRLLDDPGRRAELAAAGRAQAATWPTEDDTVAQVLSIYDELAQR